MSSCCEFKAASLPFLFDRDCNSDKRDYGHALLIAGSRGMMGAAVLASRACLRSGVGLLTVHCPRCGTSILQGSIPEAMVEEDEHESITTAIPLARHYSAIALGPGLGRDAKTANCVLRLLEELAVRQEKLTLIIDADAINILAMLSSEVICGINAQVILTPHIMEFKRLIAMSTTPPADFLEEEEARLQAQQAWSVAHHATILRKAHRSVITDECGRVSINRSGNAGMATAGSGDTLTGIVLSLAAQKVAYAVNHSFEMPNVAAVAAYLHGMAGDMAANALGQASVTASDIIAYIPSAIKALGAELSGSAPK